MADEKLIFVGGGMRTGTTILHRVLCSSPESHPYISECWYTLNQLQICLHALQRYDMRYKDFFGEKKNFEAFSRGILQNHFRLTLSRYPPATALIQKHPDMGQYFSLLAKWFREARFVVSLRDPRDTVASMVDIGERHKADGLNTAMTEMGRDMKKLCRFYLRSYADMNKGTGTPKERTIFVRYEDLMAETERTVEKLSGFLKLPFDMDALRHMNQEEPGSAYLDKDKRQEDAFSKAFWSDLYTKGLSTERIGRYKQVLSPEEIEEIQNHCAKFNRIAPYW